MTKRLLPVTLITALSARAQSLPTKLPLTQIAYPAVTATSVLILTPTGFVIAKLDSSITLDMTVPSAPVLRITPVNIVTTPPANKPEREEIFNITTIALNGISLSSVPAIGTLVKVYINGLAVNAGDDYTINGGNISPSAVALWAVGYKIKVQYIPQ